MPSSTLKLITSYCERKTVLEFGSGKSTIEIGKVARNLVSIDTDQYYVKKYSAKARDLGLVISVVHWNIGPISKYGYPMPSLRFFFRNKYQASLEELISKLNLMGFNPDIIFIDGRFRVACFMICYKYFAKKNLLFFVDDYQTRNQYKVIEELVGKPSKIFGDMALFHIKDIKNIDESKYKKSYSDPD